MNSLLLKKPTIATSSSTPNLTKLERKFSLSRSTDDITPHLSPNATTISNNLTTLEEEAETRISVSLMPPLHLGGEMVSSSAPGSLQSSPRSRSPRSLVPLAATPEAVDRPRCVDMIYYYPDILILYVYISIDIVL